MATSMVIRSVFSTEAWRPLDNHGCYSSSSSSSSLPTWWRACDAKARKIGLVCGGPIERRYLRSGRSFRFACSQNDEMDQGPPQEAILKAISEVSKTEGRVGHTTNVVIGGTVADDTSNEWLALDQKVNSYPTERGFTAIGIGGDDFVHAMIDAVESVIKQPIPEDRIRQKLSSRGKYVSVKIGPVHVVSSEQVQAVYNAMRRDVRMKYFL